MQTPVLEGPNIRLEPLTLDHLPALEAIAFDPTISRYMTDAITTPQALRAWVDTALKAQAAGNTLPWVTVQKSHDSAPDRLVGCTRFLDLDLRHRAAELGHTWLIAACRGTGVNTEAKLLQLTYAFDTLNLNRVAFKTHHENKQSQNAMKAIGCIYEGTFRNHYIMPDGSQRNSVWFSIIRPDWPEVKELLTRRLKASV